MYFVTYQYASFSEAGVLSNDRKRIIPITSIGKILDMKLPEKMTDFIRVCDDKLLTDIQQVLDNNPSLGIAASKLRLLAPIPRPERNIFCLGKNYLDHVKEIDNIPNLGDTPESPIYFSKLSSAVTGPDSVILSHKSATRQVDYEVELAVIIGRQGANIRPEEAEAHIFGYTIANDITARDLQRKHSQWYKGKSLDTFCPLGPAILSKNAVAFPPDLPIRCRINGELRQESTTGKMIFDIPTIISDLSRGVTLYPGDIILTGTPSGIGMAQDPPRFLEHGDVIESEIEGIGILKNTIQ
ncbi:MAG: fumarylacetoacetate hydrolase family protein [Eubacterium sp.]|nr:fumarylacetoacetate hydrolase family protein [Eubacterium sp.]